MRFSYATIALPTLTPLQALEELSRSGYRGVEWKVGEAPHAMSSTSAFSFLTNNKCTLDPDATDSQEIRDACAAAGLTIVGLGPYLAVGDENGLRQMMQLASDLGASQVRLQAPRTTSGTFCYAKLAEETRQYLAFAEGLAATTGVRVVLEMHHNTIAPSAALAFALVSRLDPARIGVIYDAGNVVWEGYENPRMAFQILGPYLHHVHLKNAAVVRSAPGGKWGHVWSPLDVGMVPVAEILGQLNDHGYTGWVSVEDLSTERDPLATLRFNAAVLSGMPEASWPGASAGSVL
jgi:sugar phosphate isomerase/epimerase